MIYRIVRYSNIFGLFDYYIPNRTIQLYIGFGIALFFLLNLIALLALSCADKRYPAINRWIQMLLQQYFHYVIVFPLLEIFLHFAISTTERLPLRICAGISLIIPVCFVLLAILREKVRFKLTSKDPVEKCRSLHDYVLLFSQILLLVLSKLASVHGLRHSGLFAANLVLAILQMVIHYKFLEYVKQTASHFNCIGIVIWAVASTFFFIKFDYPQYQYLWPVMLIMTLLLGYGSLNLDKYIKGRIVFHNNYLNLSIKDFELAMKLILHSAKEGKNGDIIQKHRSMMFLTNCMLSAKHLGKSSDWKTDIKQIIKEFQTNYFEGKRGGNLKAFKQTVFELIDVLFQDRLALIRSDKQYIELAFVYFAFMMGHRKNPNRSYQISMKIFQKIDNIALPFIKSFLFESHQQELNMIYNSDIGETIEFAPAFIYDKLRIETKAILKETLEDHLKFFSLLTQKTIDLDVVMELGLKMIERKAKLEETFDKALKMNPRNREIHLQYRIYCNLGLAIERINNYKVLEQRMLEAYAKDDRQLHLEFMKKPDVYSSKISAVFISLSDRRLGKIIRCTSSLANMFGYNEADLKHVELESLMPVIYAEHHQKIIARRSKEPRKIDRTHSVPAITKSGFLIQVGIKIRSEPFQNELCAAALISKCPLSSHMVLLDKWGHILNYSEKFHRLIGLEDPVKKPLYGLNIATFIPALLTKVFEESKLLELTSGELHDRTPRHFSKGSFVQIHDIKLHKYLFLPELPKRQKEYEDAKLRISKTYNPLAFNAQRFDREQLHIENFIDSSQYLHSESSSENTRVFKIYAGLQRERKQISDSEVIEGWILNITSVQELQRAEFKEARIMELKRLIRGVKVRTEVQFRRSNLFRPTIVAGNKLLEVFAAAASSPEKLKVRSQQTLDSPGLPNLRTVNSSQPPANDDFSSDLKLDTKRSQTNEGKTDRKLLYQVDESAEKSQSQTELDQPSKKIQLPMPDVDISSIHSVRKQKPSYKTSLEESALKSFSDEEVDELFQDVHEEADIQVKTPKSYKEAQFTERLRSRLDSDSISFGFRTARSRVNTSRPNDVVSSNQRETNFPLRRSQREGETQRLETEEPLISETTERENPPPLILHIPLVNKVEVKKERRKTVKLPRFEEKTLGTLDAVGSSLTLDMKTVYNPTQQDLAANLEINLDSPSDKHERIGLSFRRNTKRRSRHSSERIHSHHMVDSYRRAMFNTETPQRLWKVGIYGWIAFFVFVTTTTVLLTLLFSYLNTYLTNIGISDNNTPYLNALSIFTMESEKTVLLNAGALDPTLWPANVTNAVTTERMIETYTRFHDQYILSVDQGDITLLFESLRSYDTNITIKLNNQTQDLTSAETAKTLGELNNFTVGYLGGLLQLYSVLHDALEANLTSFAPDDLLVKFFRENYFSYLKTLNEIVKTFSDLLQPENQSISVQTYLTVSMIVNLVLTFIFIASAYPIYYYNETMTIHLLSFLGRLSIIRIKEKLCQFKTALAAVSNHHQKKLTHEVESMQKERAKNQQESFRNYSECVKKRTTVWIFVFVSVAVYGILTLIYVLQTLQIRAQNEHFYPMLTEFGLVTNIYASAPSLLAITYLTLNVYRESTANLTLVSDFLAHYQDTLKAIKYQSHQLTTYFYEIGKNSQNYLSEEAYFDYVFHLRDNDICSAYLKSEGSDETTLSVCLKANEVLGNLTLPLIIAKFFTALSDSIEVLSTNSDPLLVGEILNNEEFVALDTILGIGYVIFQKWNTYQNTELEYAIKNIRKSALAQFIVAIVAIIFSYFTVWRALMRSMKKEWLNAKKIFSLIPVELLLQNLYLKEVFKTQHRDE